MYVCIRLRTPHQRVIYKFLMEMLKFGILFPLKTSCNLLGFRVRILRFNHSFKIAKSCTFKRARSAALSHIYTKVALSAYRSSRPKNAIFNSLLIYVMKWDLESLHDTFIYCSKITITFSNSRSSPSICKVRKHQLYNVFR